MFRAVVPLLRCQPARVPGAWPRQAVWGAALVVPRALPGVRGSSTVAALRTLRETTNAGIMDCKKALEESGGDLEKAVDWLRKRGVAKASKLSSRVAAEGVVLVTEASEHVTLLEINSETDFVARNSKFHAFVQQLDALAQRAPKLEPEPATNAAPIDLASLLAAELPDPVNPQTTVPLSEALKSLSANFGEKLVISRGVSVSAPGGVVGAYVHNQVGTGMGMLAAAVGLQCTPAPSPDQREALGALARKLAMHVVGSATSFLSIERCAGPEVEKERKVHEEWAQTQQKPAHILEKMIQGRMKKFYEDSVLLEQKSVTHEGQPKVGKVVEDARKELGLDTLEVTAFARFKCGELMEGVVAQE